MRLLTYNIRYGGAGRASLLADVVRAASPDVVILQEAFRPDVVEEMAAATGMTTWAADGRHSVAFMSRRPVFSHAWHRPGPSRRAFLEIALAEPATRLFGVHLSAVHSNWTERRRARELRAVLAGIKEHDKGFHVLAGDFNTVAPGATLDIRKLPPRLQAVVWLTGRKIRWETIQIMLDASYLDAFRALNPADPGFTFPTWDPHVRLDYVFLPKSSASRLLSCEVFIGHPSVRTASDHLPLLAEIDLGELRAPAFEP